MSQIPIHRNAPLILLTLCVPNIQRLRRNVFSDEKLQSYSPNFRGVVSENRRSADVIRMINQIKILYKF